MQQSRGYEIINTFSVVRITIRVNVIQVLIIQMPEVGISA